MKVCPNKSSKDWIELVDSVGEFEAYRVFISNNYEIPTTKLTYDKAPVTARAKARKVLLDKGIIDKYNKLKVDYGTALRATGELNRELRTKYGIKEQLIEYEDGKKSILFKEALFKSIDASIGITYDEQSESGISKVKDIIQKNTSTVSEVLELVSKDKNSGTSSKIAKRLLKLISNDTKVIKLSATAMKAKAEQLEGRSLAFSPRGFYEPDSNVIYLSEDAYANTIIHEILHAFTYGELRAGTREGRKLRELYSYIQEQYPETKGQYAMKNIDEFMVGIFTKPEFIKFLASKPSMTGRKLTLWDDVIQAISSALEYLGFKQKMANSLLAEAMDLGIRVIESSKNRADVKNAEDAYYSELMEYESSLAYDLEPEVEAEQFQTLEELLAEKQIVSRERIALEKIKQRLETLDKVYGQKLKKTEAGTKIKDDLSKFKDKIGTIEEMQAIQEFIVETAKVVREFERLMSDIKSKPTDTANIARLVASNGIINSFDILREIHLEIYDDPELEEKDRLAIQQWYKDRAEAEINGTLDTLRPEPVASTELIRQTREKIDRLHHNYRIEGAKLMARKMFPLISESLIAESKKLKSDLLKKNKDDARAKAIIVTEEDLERELLNSSTDISGWSRWMGSTMGDENAILALTAKLIKENLEAVNDDLRQDEHDLGNAFEEYVKESGLSKDNVVALNEAIIQEREVTDYVGKEKKVVTVKQFVEKVDWEKYIAARDEFISTLTMSENDPKYAEAIGKWYSENNKPKDNWQEIVDDREANLTPEEFKKWKKKNFDSQGKVKGELREPDEKYLSSKWSSMYDSTGNPISSAGRYHAALIKKYDELVEQLDYKERIELTSKGRRLPSVYKSDWERAFNDKNLKKVAKDKFKITAEDTNYALVETSGKEHKAVPLFYTQLMDADDCSSDVFSSMMLAAKNWRQYRAKANIQAEVQLVKDLVAMQEVDDTNTKGETKVNRISRFLKETLKKGGESNLKAKLEDNLDTIFYGIEDEKQNIQILGKTVSVDKSLQNLMFVSSAISLTANVISGISNLTLGNIMVATEAHAGDYLTKKDVASGYADYAKSIGNFVLDAGKTTGKSLETQLTEYFEFEQGSYIDHYGNNVSGSKAKKMMSTSSLMFINNGAEHQIQNSSGFAFLRGIKFIDGKFIGRKEYLGSSEDNERRELEKKYDSTKESLRDAFELDSKGVIKIKDEYKTAWDLRTRSTIKNRIHETNKYLHGNYATFDKPALQKQWYGKLALFFRKHIQSGLARRFGRRRVNHAMNDVVAGMYTDTFNSIVDFMKNILTEMKQVGFAEAVMSNAKKFTPSQRANMRRTFAEGFALLTMVAIVSMLSGGGDDDEDNTWAQNLMLLEARRLQSELNFYSNPLEAFRTIKSPTVTMGTVESTIKFGWGLLTEWGEDARYKRDTGIWEKGDSKDLARAVRLIPGLKAILSLKTPEEQYKTFNKLF